MPEAQQRESRLERLDLVARLRSEKAALAEQLDRAVNRVEYLEGLLARLCDDMARLRAKCAGGAA